MIDRATQKLRLDQIVIQQGRHTTAKGTKPSSHNLSFSIAAANKNELVSMIQHGAESIFQSTDSTIASDDLEAILAKSEAKSKELQKKYMDMGLDDLQQFTSEQEHSTYTWEGQDFRKKKGSEFNWIGPGGVEGGLRPRRGNRKTVNYSGMGSELDKPGASSPLRLNPSSTDEDDEESDTQGDELRTKKKPKGATNSANVSSQSVVGPVITNQQKNIATMQIGNNLKKKKSIASIAFVCLGMLELDAILIDAELVTPELRATSFSPVQIALKQESDRKHFTIQFHQPDKPPISYLHDKAASDLFEHLHSLKFECRISFNQANPVVRLLLYSSGADAESIGLKLYEKGYILRTPDVKPKQQYHNPQFNSINGRPGNEPKKQKTTHSKSNAPLLSRFICYGMIETVITDLIPSQYSELMKSVPFTSVKMSLLFSSQDFPIIQFYESLNNPIASLNAAMCQDLAPHLETIKFESRLDVTTPYPCARLLIYGKATYSAAFGRYLFERGHRLLEPDITPKEPYENPQMGFFASTSLKSILN